jgi:hypothetical protein
MPTVVPKSFYVRSMLSDRIQERAEDLIAIREPHNQERV